MDLFVVPTISFRLLYGILIMGHGRRQILWLGVTAHPTAEWIANQLMAACGWEELPRYLIRDRDARYGDIFVRRVRSLGILDHPTAARSPWQNGYAERWIGSIRRECLDHVGEDLIWCTADTGWSKAGTSILFGPWSCGSAVLFYNGRFDVEQRFALLENFKVTVFCAAATEFRQLVLKDAHQYDLSSLRLAISAGETVNPEIVERWRALTGVALLDGYGQTETLMTVLNYPAMPVKPGSMGRPLPGTHITVLDKDNRPVKPGEAGRLMIRLPNPQLMLCYWNDPELTRAAIVQNGGAEWFDSGDVVKSDSDGYVFYLGRADDLINSSGYRIGPVEVENALMEHAAVQECAVVASPDADRGEVVKAFIVLRPGTKGDDALAQEIQEHVKRITAPYKYPRKIEFVGQLPKTPTGKIQRRMLRDREFAAGARRTGT